MDLQLHAQQFIETCDFKKGDGLIPVVVQDETTKEVLMLAYMDKEALLLTLSKQTMYYHSRKRGLWHKGDTSGAYQHVVSLSLDCDADTLLAVVKVDGPSCHNGTTSCFNEEYNTGRE